MPDRDRQLALELPFRTARGRADFLVSPCNQAAVAKIDDWPNWPTRCLVLWGPKGSGKTHLAQVWQEKAGASAARHDQMAAAIEAAGRGQPISLELDDEIGDEAALLHLFNWSRENGAELLLTGTEPPARWNITLLDLKSRLLAAPNVGLLAPDDPLISAIMVKQFADRQIRINADLVAYLAPRIERTFEAVGKMVDQLDTAGLREGRALTIPFAKRVLGF